MVVPPSTGGATATVTAPTLSPSDPATVPVAPSSKTKSGQQPVSAPGTLNGPPSGNNHAIPLSARRAEPLDLSTVERRGQPNMPVYKEQKERLFGIPNAPSFHPTEEEFRDPMEYMRKITPEGSKYGIIKIVPPDRWQPTFAINTERFHFRTRRQELNSVEGGNRVNNDYLDQLARFHKQNGHNLNRFPSVDKRPLDLYRLKKTVERKGGFDTVCKGKRWAEVGRDLGYSGKIMSSLSTSLKNSYQKWLLPYEEYLRVAKPGVHHQLEMMNGGPTQPYTPSPGPSPAKKAQGQTPTSMNGTPTMQASAALNATINGQGSPPSLSHEVSTQSHPGTSNTGGFTPVNAGGGFTAVNAPTPAASFTSVNGPNGFHSNGATPQRTLDTPPSNNGQQAIAPHPNGVAALKRQHSDQLLSPDELDAIGRRSKRLRKDVPTVAGSNMHHSSHSRMAGGKAVVERERGDHNPGEVCESCLRPEKNKMIECGTCDSVYHMYCLEPPLKERPPFEWHCPRCLVGTGEYGFEEGDVHSLAGFQRKANEFKKYHFETLGKLHSPFTETKRHLDEADIEKEFWRLVDELSDATEVEYGADIHCTTHGSGFPTIEKQPRDAYSTDPWNLNILPLDKESLFRHVKSDVSGMTIPWLYVGMIFSTFCWHNEDHFAYSANYQHFGETKTWYGVPGEDAYKFEAAMKGEMPELFETQPDLMFQLVTLARPEKLRKAGVRVYAIDQHAGEFVVTFPRAYHAGFNQGFNFNEAVNFAPIDWEPFGKEGVERLRNYRKQPCFSHDEMLLTAGGRDNSIKTSKWLAPAMEQMRDEELAARKQFLEGADAESGVAPAEPYLGPRYKATPEMIDPEKEEEECICHYCKCYCYLSRFRCNKTGKHLCLLHAGSFECCDSLEFERYSGQNGDHTLLYRMTDDALVSTVKKVVDKATIPEAWAAKVDSELDDTPRPSLKHLRTLLTEGEKIQHDLPQLADLRRFVERCNEWVEEATNYITRKQQSRRKSEKGWRKGMAKQAELEERDKELRKVDNIRKLLNSADEIGFECPEITTLRERAESIADFQRDADAALNNIRSNTTTDFEELLERGKEFHVDIPEIGNLERVVKRLQWDDMAKSKKPNSDTRRQEQTLKQIDNFIEEGLAIGVPDTNPDLIFFREHKAQAELWEQKAKELMAAEQVHYQQLDSLSTQAATLPVSAETLAAVDGILKKQREVQERIMALVEQSKDPDFRKRPHYEDMRQILKALEELQSKPAGTIDLEKLQKQHEDWMRRGKKLFGKSNAPLHILLQHMKLVSDRNESCFDLTDKPRMPVEPSSRANSPEAGAEEQPITDGSNSSRDVFCICRKSEAGMMIECEICHEWYHGKCLKIARGKVKEDDKYTCPICDWRVKIPRDAARPKLEDLQAWQDELLNLPFQPEEEAVLDNVTEYGQNFRDFLRPIVNPENPTTPEEIGTLRFYLRKIEGADILLAEETNYLRQELHKWAPVASEPPPKMEVSNSTRKPRPTKQQKLMAQLGITNPNDLPLQYKIKPHVAKRKASEAFSKNQPLQPATSSSMSPTNATAQSPMLGPARGQTPNGTRPFLTPLSIQVLGELASAPVVSKVLTAEPHMNSEKLLKMKGILMSDESAKNIEADVMKQRIADYVGPVNVQPAYGYGGSSRRSSTPKNPAANSTPGQGPMWTNLPSSSGPALGHAPAPLASPGQFSFQPHASPTFDNHIYDGAGGSMFESPSNENKAQLASPNFGAQSGSMFDSPKPAPLHAGLGSPGFGAGQHSANNIDNVFADLLHDHDHDHDHDHFGGFDGANEAKERMPEQETGEKPAGNDTDAGGSPSAHTTQGPAEAADAEELPSSHQSAPVLDGKNEPDIQTASPSEKVDRNAVAASAPSPGAEKELTDVSMPDAIDAPSSARQVQPPNEQEPEPEQKQEQEQGHGHEEAQAERAKSLEMDDFINPEHH